MTLRIFLDNIVLWAPSILHFKGLGIRNLQNEMKICQKSHNKVTKTVLNGSNFYVSDVNLVNIKVSRELSGYVPSRSFNKVQLISKANFKVFI